MSFVFGYLVIDRYNIWVHILRGTVLDVEYLKSVKKTPIVMWEKTESVQCNISDEIKMAYTYSSSYIVYHS